MLRPTKFEGPELGFMVPKSAWGRGYATEVCAAVLTWAHRHEVPFVYAVTDHHNRASQRVLAKFGFVPVEEPAQTGDRKVYRRQRARATSFDG